MLRHFYNNFFFKKKIKKIFNAIYLLIHFYIAYTFLTMLFIDTLILWYVINVNVDYFILILINKYFNYKINRIL